jgi:hypothetical protein
LQRDRLLQVFQSSNQAIHSNNLSHKRRAESDAGVLCSVFYVCTPCYLPLLYLHRPTLGLIKTLSVASFLKSQPMRWTRHMEDCLQHLANEPETPGDEVLVTIVKISKVMDDVNAAHFKRLFESETQGPSSMPPVLHVKALVASLDAIKESLRPELLQNSAYPFCIPRALWMINSPCRSRQFISLRYLRDD